MAETVRLAEIGVVGAMAADAERLYVGSNINDAASAIGRLLVAIDHADITKARWVVPLSDNGGPFLKDGVLWVSGAFREIAGQPRQGLAALDPATGALLPETVRFDFRRLGSPAYSVIKAAEGDNFVVAGNFTSVNGLPRQGLAILDFRTGEVLPWNPAKDGGYVQAVALTTNAVYVLGDFYEIGGGARQHFAMFDRLAVPQLRSPRFSAEGFTAQVSAAPGYEHVLQRSLDLKDWQTVSTVTPEDTDLTVNDSYSAPGPRFYRLVLR